MEQKYVTLSEQAKQKEAIRDYTLKYISQDWKIKLLPFLSGAGFSKILDELLIQENRPLTPQAKDWFRAFKETPYKDLKVIILGQDPYPQPGVADGLAFSCSMRGVAQPSLEFIHGEMMRTLGYEQRDLPVDLKSWANQGVLLLNVALTAKINTTNAHARIWAPFITYLFETLDCDRLIYVLMGREAQKFEGAILPFSNDIIKVEHPNAASYRTDKVWHSGDLFNHLNKLIEAKNGKDYTIRW